MCQKGLSRAGARSLRSRERYVLPKCNACNDPLGGPASAAAKIYWTIRIDTVNSLTRAALLSVTVQALFQWKEPPSMPGRGHCGSLFQPSLVEPTETGLYPGVAPPGHTVRCKAANIDRGVMHGFLRALVIGSQTAQDHHRQFLEIGAVPLVHLAEQPHRF